MGQRRALLVGVPTYDSEAIPNLPVVSNDLGLMRRALEASGYQITEIHGGGQSPPSRGKILMGIRRFCRSARERDTLFLYFSGHGVHFEGRDFLVPFDGVIEDKDLEEFLVPVDFVGEFNESKAATIVFFVDACREGIELGSKSVSLKPWGSGKLRRSQRHERAIVFSCRPGEVSRFVPGPEGFSLFTGALAEVLDPGHPATKFGEVEDGLQSRLHELADEHGKNRQTIRVRLESDVEDALRDRQICDGPSDPELPAADRDPWLRATRNSHLWSKEEAGGPSELKTRVEGLVVECRRIYTAASEALPNDAWRDEQLPVRVLERLEFLTSICRDSLTLTDAESALLVAAPFVREAVLASAVLSASEAEPLTLGSSEAAGPLRQALEKIHRAKPQMVRKANRLLEQELRAEHDAVAIWMMHQCLLRVPEVWMAPPTGYLAETLTAALEACVEGPSRIAREALTASRLLELARCVHSDPERIEREDHPESLRGVIHLAASSADEQVLREKLLAYLLSLAGRMAIDVRTLPDVVADHVGLSDPLVPENVVQTIAEAVWVPAARGRALEVRCRHPAIDFALREHVEQARVVVDAIHHGAHQKRDELEALAHLPLQLTADEVVAEVQDDGSPAYETPHLRFQLAHDEVRELLMGEQLYGDPSLAIRELYQNALDACRYRQARITYLERTGAYEGPEWTGRIVFRQGHDQGRPYIECCDNGIGMGRRQLTGAFARAGRRFADMPEFIEEQAQWLTCDPPVQLFPNSQFGIGVLSYFMLADELLIETCRVDRTGNPGERLQVQVSGSGSLFRIRPLQEGIEAGTRIRLYLNRTSYKGEYGREKRISCLETLREILRIAQFETEVTEGSESDTWPPDQLKGVDEEHRATADPHVWWVEHDGCLLADGLAIDNEQSGAVVDLSERHRPRLTIDRRKAVDWDEQHVRELLRENVEALVEEPPSWLSFAWLWNLEQSNPDAVSRLWARLLEKGPLQKLPLTKRSRGYRRDLGDLAISMAELGCFYPDYQILGAHGSSDPDIQEFLVDRVQRTMPAELLPIRLEVLTRNGLELPDRLKRKLPAAHPGPKALAAPRAGDALMNAVVKPFEGRISLVRMFVVAHKLGETVEAVLDRVRRYAPLGVQVPDLDLEKLEGAALTSADLQLLSRDLDGQEPWLQDKISIGHLVRWVSSQDRSRSTIVEQLERLASYGLMATQVDYERLSTTATKKDAVLLISMNCNGRAPFLEDKVPLSHLLHVSAKLGQSVGEVSRHPVWSILGLKMPDPLPLADIMVTKADLVLISIDLDGVAPWLDDSVSTHHITKAVQKTGQSTDAVRQRLEQLGFLVTKES